LVALSNKPKALHLQQLKPPLMRQKHRQHHRPKQLEPKHQKPPLASRCKRGFFLLKSLPVQISRVIGVDELLCSSDLTI
jgi:hypothetical protein